MRVGDTLSKPKSWVGAGGCRGTGTWIREGREAGLGRERKLGLKRVGDTQLKSKSWVGAGGATGMERGLEREGKRN